MKWFKSDLSHVLRVYFKRLIMHNLLNEWRCLEQHSWNTLFFVSSKRTNILHKILSKDRYPVVRERMKKRISSFPLSGFHSSKVERAKSALPGCRCLFARRVFSIPKRYSDVRVGTRWELQVISSIISRVCNPSHVLDNPISQGEPFSFALRLCDRSRFAFTGKLKTKIVQTWTKEEVGRDAFQKLRFRFR